LVSPANEAVNVAEAATGVVTEQVAVPVESVVPVHVLPPRLRVIASPASDAPAVVSVAVSVVVAYPAFAVPATVTVGALPTVSVVLALAGRVLASPANAAATVYVPGASVTGWIVHEAAPVLSVTALQRSVPRPKLTVFPLTGVTPSASVSSAESVAEPLYTAVVAPVYVSVVGAGRATSFVPLEAAYPASPANVAVNVALAAIGVATEHVVLPAAEVVAVQELEPSVSVSCLPASGELPADSVAVREVDVKPTLADAATVVVGASVIANGSEALLGLVAESPA
jgi:hypothetical protein